MVKNDGGPAFPVPGLDGQNMSHGPVYGMSLRDWFAGMAFQALLSNEPFLRGVMNLGESCGEQAVAGAYELADALLKEREK